MEISISKETDLAKIISSVENISIEEGKKLLKESLPGIKKDVLAHADIMSIYLIYENAKNKEKSPEEIKNIVNKKSLELVKRISDFENIKITKAIQKFKDSQIYHNLIDQNSDYWMKPVQFIFSDYLKEIKYEYVEDDGYIEDDEFAKMKRYNK